MSFISNMNDNDTEMIGGLFRNGIFVRSFASNCNLSFVESLLWVDPTQSYRGIKKSYPRFHRFCYENLLIFVNEFLIIICLISHSIV